MTSNPTLHIHPSPPIDLDALYDTDPLDIIAAGIGWPIIRRTTARMKPDQNVGLLATLITEGATGIEYNTACDFPLDKMNERFINKRGDVYMILDDLPRSVFYRVCDLLHDGRPDAALRVIQAHHNVVKSLSDPNNQTYGNDAKPPYGEYIYDPTPITESWVGEIDDTPDSGSGEPQLVLKAVEPRNIREGYTYILHNGINYGPVPVNELDPPMVHRDKHPRFSPPYTEEFGGKPLVPSFS